LTILEAANNDLHEFSEFAANIFAFEPADDVEGPVPSEAWQQHWLTLRAHLGEERLRQFVLSLVEVYQKFTSMTGTEPFYRITAGWQAASLDDSTAAEWVVRMTTEHGERSPVLAASLLHPYMPPAALAGLADAWSGRVAEVPTGSSWSREFTVLILR